MEELLDLLLTPHLAAIRQLLLEQEARYDSDKRGFRRFRELLAGVRDLRATHLDLGGDVVAIGRREELSEEEYARLYRVLREFMPWRKGPFNIFGIEIDAEWRSERKWNRLLPALPDLRGKVIADIGSNNGYYMFRMAAQEPRLVLGFEPTFHHYFTFRVLNHLAGLNNLQTVGLGVEQIKLFPECFDVVFLMGIIYHRISPITMLQEIWEAMKAGATLIVESQAIPGEEPVALFPEQRYAKAPGTYFVPTAPCLRNWLLRAGFREVDFVCSHPMDSTEQRQTEWMAFESYQDYLDPDNPKLTVEGYPAPIRVYFRAVK